MSEKKIKQARWTQGGQKSKQTDRQACRYTRIRKTDEACYLSRWVGRQR